MQCSVGIGTRETHTDLSVGRWGYIRIHQSTLEYIGIHRNTSGYIRIYQDTSEFGFGFTRMGIPLYHSGTGLLLAGLAVCTVGLLVRFLKGKAKSRNEERMNEE